MVTVRSALILYWQARISVSSASFTLHFLQVPVPPQELLRMMPARLAASRIVAPACIEILTLSGLKVMLK